MSEIKVVNYKICRICLMETDTKSLFDGMYENHTLNELFEICTSVQVKREDNLPCNVCMTCTSRLCHTFDFIKACKESDDKLRSALLFESELPAFPTFEENEDYYFKIDDFIEEIDCKNGYDITDEITESNNVEVEEAELPMPSSESLENITMVNNIPNRKRKRVIKKFYKCRVCHETFETSSKMKAHYKKAKHPGKATRTCPICSKVYYGKTLFNIHMLSHSKEKPFKCEMCSVGCVSKVNLRRHMLIHTGVRPYVCEMCGKAFTQSYALTEHHRIHTNELPFMCSYCGKKFRTSATYKNHLLVHEGTKIECKICNVTLCPKSLPNHMMQVHNEPSEPVKVKCEICQKVLSSKATLRCHISQVHGKKLIKCYRCNKKFETEEEKTNHSCTANIESYLCTTCGKTFSQVNGLVQHKRIHTGERPFVCQTCGRAFTQRHQLIYHMRTHSGERPYVCPYCNKTFALNGNLTVHIRIHTGETPFVCDVCNKGFRDSSSMKKHKKSHYYYGPELAFEEN